MKKIKNLKMYINFLEDICVYDEYEQWRQMKRLFFKFYPELKIQMSNNKKDFEGNFAEFFLRFIHGFIPIEAIKFKHTYQEKRRYIGNRTIVLINFGFGLIDEYLEEFEAIKGNSELAYTLYQKDLIEMSKLI